MPFKAEESGLLVVFMSPGANVTLEEFHNWYDTEHVPLRINRFTAFRSAVRYSVTSTTLTPLDEGGVDMPPVCEWGAFYTVSSNITFADKAYIGLREQRSELEAELFTRLAIVDRRIYRLEYDSDLDDSITTPRKKLGLKVQKQADTPKYLVTNSVDMTNETNQKEYNKWFDQEHATLLSKVPGWKRSRRFTLIDNGVNGTEAKKGHAGAVPKCLGLHGKFCLLPNFTFLSYLR